MNKGHERAILGFVHSHPKSYKDWEFKVDENPIGEIFLSLVVDCEKMDRNSGNFDQEYYNSIMSKYNEMGYMARFISGYFGVLNDITEDIKTFFTIDIRPLFDYKNYEYLDNIEDKIRMAVKKTSQPNVNASFKANGQKPTIDLIFSNFRGPNKDDHVNYTNEVQNLLGDDIDLSNYSVVSSYN